MPTTQPPEPFCALYTQNVEPVYRYHLIRTGSRDAAEDLTAETFFAALASFDRLRLDQPALPWLFGIARHKLGDYQRRRFFKGLLRSQPLDVLENTPAAAQPLEEQVIHSLDAARVAQALSTINRARAEAVAMHYYGGLSMEEIAQVMVKSEEAVKQLVQRGLAELRTKLTVDRATEDHEK